MHADASVARIAPERVLLWMPSGRRVLGGHVVQIERTARALGEIGLETRIDFSREPEPIDVDLVHGFGLHAPDIRRWHARGVPVVLSSIYWDRDYRLGDGTQRLGARRIAGWARRIAGRARRAAQFARAALRGRSTLIEASLTSLTDELEMITAFESADLLLPNAVGEAESIRRDLGVSTPMIPVPNGVDPQSFSDASGPFEERGYVLFVGRIEPHKNQLGLIQALRGSGLPLVIAGYEHPDHQRYLQQCRAAGAGWVTFHIGHETAALPDLYRGARVHVLPTWFETTGLVSLEAALSGCSVVSTSRGHAREYFGDLAWYCDPRDPSSILNAVRQGWATPPAVELKQRVLERYTWRHVAEATAAAYRALLEQSSDYRPTASSRAPSSSVHVATLSHPDRDPQEA
jgi:glycosyltransferase involved in cell wall biosynthesis